MGTTPRRSPPRRSERERLVTKHFNDRRRAVLELIAKLDQPPPPDSRLVAEDRIVSLPLDYLRAVDDADWWTDEDRRAVLIASQPSLSIEEINSAGDWPVRALHTWIEMPVSDRWTAAYFIVDQDGAPTVGEVRLFPTEPYPARPRGAWSGWALGARARVPRGGITTEILRKVRLSPVLRSPLPDESLKPLSLGFGGVTFVQLPKKEDPKRPGRAPVSDESLVQVAAAYDAAMKRRHLHPVQHVASVLGLERSLVRDYIHKARERDLLTRTGQGVPGGELTPRGRALLAELRPVLEAAGRSRKATARRGRKRRRTTNTVTR